MSKEVERLLAEAEGATHMFVHYDDNWADEFDIDGFRVFTKSQFVEFINEINEKIAFPASNGFGTNEDIEYDEPDAYLRVLRAKRVSERDYKAFIRMFGRDEAGMWYEPDELKDEDED